MSTCPGCESAPGAAGAGGVLGAVLLGRALKRYGYGPFLVRAYLVGIVSGVAVIGANIAETTLWQLIVPRHLQGRVGASFNFVIGALGPVAALVAGLLGTTIGLRATLAVSAALIPFSMLCFIRSPLPHLRAVEPAATRDRRTRGPGDMTC